MGTPRKTVEAKRRAGTLRPRARNPRPRPVEPDKPRSLSREAARHWGRLAPELVRVGMLTVVDGISFSQLCESIVRLERADRAVAKLGARLTVQRPSGRRPAPELAIQRAALADYLRLARAFGLSPESRGQEALPAHFDDLAEKREADAFFGRRRASRELLETDSERDPRRRGLRVVRGGTLRAKPSAPGPT